MFLRLSLILLSFFFGNIIFSQNRTLSPELQSSILHRINNHMNASIVIGIIDKDGPHYFSFGKVKNGGKNANEHSIYEIGSLTKVFTATLLADNIIKGTMHADDPVSAYLPASVKMPAFDSMQITLGHLTDHTSALPRLPNNFGPKDLSNPYADYEARNLFDFLSGYELTRPVGSQFEYSNLAVGLLGHLLAMHENTTYEKLMVAKIADPFQMKETRTSFTHRMKKNLAVGYDQDIEVPNWDFTSIAGAGAIRSSVYDMLKFLEANLHPQKYAIGEAIQLTHVPRHHLADGDKMGMGWFIEKGKNGDIYYHGGATGGYRSFGGFVKETGVGVIVLTNSTESIDDIGHHILDPDKPLRHLLPHIALKLKEIIETDGPEDLESQFDKIKKSNDVEYDYSETGLNALGYYFLNRKKYKEALAVFALNIREYPLSSNVYDSYGEAFMESGQTEPAIENYQKSLQINPANTNAIAMLAKMGVKAEVKEITVDPGVLETYTGIYELFPNFTITITHENGHLRAQATGQLAYEIFPKTQSEFYFQVVDAQITFHPDEHGVTNSLTLFQGGRTTTAKKVKS